MYFMTYFMKIQIFHENIFLQCTYIYINRLFAHIKIMIHNIQARYTSETNTDGHM